MPPKNPVEHAVKLSRYVRGLIDSGACSDDPAAMQKPFDASEMGGFLEVEADDEQGLQHALRKLRQNVMLRIIARDLGQLGDLNEVVSTISTLAEYALGTALTFYEKSLRETFGDPRNGAGDLQRTHIVAMG